MLRATHLKKEFGERKAVDDVSFEIRAGETLGLLGPNGAGKTTILAMLSGLMQPDGGSVSFGGHSARNSQEELKRRIGLVPQDLALYEELSAAANLQLFGGLYGLSGRPLAESAARALELVGLGERANERVKRFSGGMKRRLNIAGALLHDPELILLDEPPVGVDPQSRNAIFENLEELKRRGRTLLYTTHYMEEAERLCDRILIIDHGRVLADDTVRGLLRRLPASKSVRIEFDDPLAAERVVTEVAAMPGVESARAEAGTVRMDLAALGRGLASVLSRVADLGLPTSSIQPAEADLEDVFIHLTGHALRDDAPGAAAP